jgi:uncharacterized protein YigA (DUF484 family)
MSHKGELPLAESFTEDAVVDYLRGHPDFFDRHAPLLARLRLPHSTGGAAVSLVERQVAVLRERCAKLERQLKDLVAVAKFNDGLVEKIHQLALRLIAAPNLETKLHAVETSLREDFLAERAVLLLFDDYSEGVASDGFVKVLARSDTILAAFGNFLTSPRPRCGLIPDRQKEALFGRDAAAVGSAAILPLGEGDRLLGLLVIGNHDPAHFNPGKRMDFLNRLGAMIAAALDPTSRRAA